MNLSEILAQRMEPPMRMLLTSIDLCPDEVWAKSDGHPPVWQHLLHAANSLQKWIRAPAEPYNSPAFVDKSAIALEGPPEPAPGRDLVRAYVSDAVDHCRNLLANAGDSALDDEIGIDGRRYTLTDRALGQMIHIAYHVGCISTILDRYTGSPLPWIEYRRDGQA
jgi:hypothetical protein